MPGSWAKEAGFQESNSRTLWAAAALTSFVVFCHTDYLLQNFQKSQEVHPCLAEEECCKDTN